jgi:Sigma-70 region 2
MGCLPLIDSLIRKYGFQHYEDAEALRNESIIKLFKAIRYYNPERGRAFSCLTVAITRFLFSYVRTVRIRTKRMSLVADEILEQYEGPGQGRTELPEELKTKIQTIRTRFKGKEERTAFKFLINYFLLEGITQPRKLVLDTLGRQFGFSIDKAGVLYDYALVSLRSVLQEYYTPVYSPGEMLRLCRRSTVLAEIHQIVGEQCFARLLDIFAGITVTFPSKAALEKMRRSQEFLNGLNDEKRAFSSGPLSASSEEQLLSAVLEGHHTEAPLYGSEET